MPCPASLPYSDGIKPQAQNKKEKKKEKKRDGKDLNFLITSNPIS